MKDKFDAALINRKMKIQNLAGFRDNVYGLACAVAQLIAGLLMLVAMWRFITGDFRHPLSVVFALIDPSGKLSAFRYWINQPASLNDGPMALFQWPVYYGTGVYIYMVGLLIIILVYDALVDKRLNA
jgi:hypothetical protein